MDVTALPYFRHHADDVGDNLWVEHGAHAVVNDANVIFGKHTLKVVHAVADRLLTRGTAFDYPLQLVNFVLPCIGA